MAWPHTVLGAGRRPPPGRRPVAAGPPARRPDGRPPGAAPRARCAGAPCCPSGKTTATTDVPPLCFVKRFPPVSSRKIPHRARGADGEFCGGTEGRAEIPGVRVGGRRAAGGGHRARLMRGPEREHARRPLQGDPLTPEVGGEGPRVEHVGRLRPSAGLRREHRAARWTRRPRAVHRPIPRQGRTARGDPLAQGYGSREPGPVRQQDLVGASVLAHSGKRRDEPLKP